MQQLFMVTYVVSKLEALGNPFLDDSDELDALDTINVWSDDKVQSRGLEECQGEWQKSLKRFFSRQHVQMGR